MEATVVAVGNGKVLSDGKIQAMTVKPGEKVLVGKYGGSEIKIDGDEHLILREDEVLGIID